MTVLLVVAQHQEPLDWIDYLPLPHVIDHLRWEWRTMVVQKDRDVPNEGREASSWLWGMRRLAPNMPGPYDRVAFVQGEPLDHCPDLVERLQRPLHGFAWLGDASYFSDGTGSPHDSGLPVSWLYESWTGRPWPGWVRFAAGGQFQIPAGWLRRRELADYDRMLEESTQGRAAWAAERIWEAVFTSDPAAHTS